MRSLRKYSSEELQRELESRKTVYQKFRKYNTYMTIFTIVISILVVTLLIFSVYYLLLKPYEANKDNYFKKKSSIISFELSTFITCQNEDENIESVFEKVDKRLNGSEIYLAITKKDELVYFSDRLNKEETIKQIKGNGDEYNVQKHELKNSDYIIYFLIPNENLTTSFITLISIVIFLFLISTIFRNRFNHNIMKKVYSYLGRPLEKIRKGFINIKKGELDEELIIEDYYNNELKETFREFEKMRKQLIENKELSEQYETNRKEFISGISHDLKTPISSIIGYMEGLLDGVADTEEKKQNYMQIIYKKALDLNRLINDLVLFSNLDINNVNFNFMNILFSKYMHQLMEEFGMELSEENVELTYNYEGDKNKVVCIDPIQLRRVFNNIIGNAIKHFNKDNKTIEVTVLDNKKETIVKIRDNGVGIEEDKLVDIFEKFYKADESRNTEKSGSGLGLAIAKQIVNAHKGRIWAESKPNEGTTIIFTLSKEVINDKDIDNRG